MYRLILDDGRDYLCKDSATVNAVLRWLETGSSEPESPEPSYENGGPA